MLVGDHVQEGVQVHVGQRRIGQGMLGRAVILSHELRHAVGAASLASLAINRWSFAFVGKSCLLDITISFRIHSLEVVWNPLWLHFKHGLFVGFEVLSVPALPLLRFMFGLLLAPRCAWLSAAAP